MAAGLELRLLFTTAAVVHLAACNGDTKGSAAVLFPASDMTYLSYSDQHGVQIEYLAPSGKTYLWYPGNRAVVAGEWTEVLDRVCYRYGADTFNPVTRRQGGDWECRFTDILAEANLDALAGDPFDLSTTELVPSDLGKCEVPSKFALERIPTCSAK